MNIKVSFRDTQVEVENKHMPNQPFPKDSFSDVLAANVAYEKNFESSHLTGRAAQGLAIITCMDSRISPLVLTLVAWNSELLATQLRPLRLM
jgi:hypothetical protein